MAKKYKINRCSVCGGAAELRGEQTTAYVVCPDCQQYSGLFEDMDDLEVAYDHAVAAWNVLNPEATT